MLNQIRLAESDKEPICEQPLWIVYLMRLFFFTFMFATPLTINIVYVLTKGALRSDELATVQVFLSLFNKFWNSSCIPQLVFHAKNSLKIGRNGQLVQCILLMLNSIVIPCISTLLTDGLCFKEMIYGTSTISATYNLTSCITYIMTPFSCATYANVTQIFSFNPPFMYSYQCRNAVLRNYVPVVIYAGIFDAFLGPFLMMVVMSCTSKRIFEVMRFYFSPLLWPQYAHRHDTEISFSIGRGFASNFMMLCVYGIANPFTAVVLSISLIAQGQLAQFLICRYVIFKEAFSKKDRNKTIVAEDEEDEDDRVDGSTCLDFFTCVRRSATIPTLEGSYASTVRNMIPCLWSAVIISAMFDALYLFDVAFDKDSFVLSILIPCFLFGIPCSFWAYSYLCQVVQLQTEAEDENDETSQNENDHIDISSQNNSGHISTKGLTIVTKFDDDVSENSVESTREFEMTSKK